MAKETRGKKGEWIEEERRERREGIGAGGGKDMGG